MKRQSGRLKAAVVIAALVTASLPAGASPALAAKPPKNPPPPESTTTFQAVETAGGYFVSGGTLDVPVPAGTVAGDFLIAQVAYNAAGSITPPSGWTTIDVLTHPTAPIMQGLYWRTASGTEPAHYSFTLSSGKSDTAAGAIAVYTGIDTNDPIDAFAGQASAAGQPVVAPSITTGEPDTTLIGFFTVRDNGDDDAAVGNGGTLGRVERSRRRLDWRDRHRVRR